MMKIIKSLMITVLLITVAVFCLKQRDSLWIKTFQTETGWGYYISEDDKIIIMQPFIPATNGYKSFVSKKQALTVGKIVIKKLKNKENPTLGIEEIKRAGIVLGNNNNPRLKN